MKINKKAFSDRLRVLFGSDRGAVARIARATGFAHQVVTQWYKAQSLPKYEGLVRIAEATKCDLNWLLTGEGELYSKRRAVIQKAMRGPLLFPVACRVSAAPRGTIDCERVKGEFIDIPVRVKVVRVEDNSMAPIVWPGQYIWLDSEAIIRQNDLVIVRIKRRSGCLIGRISYKRKPDTVTLISINQAIAVEPITVPRRHIREVHLVLGAWYIGKSHPGAVIIKKDRK